jgi:hypothetical protein
MKRVSFAVICNILMLCFGLSCDQINHHSVNIHVSDSKQYYKMYAHYNPGKAGNVDEYMTDEIGRASHMSFVNTRIDGKLTLDNHTTFYLKKHPGYIEIKLDKDENSRDAYQKIKTMCTGIKQIISH